uniref:Uncharacterized protein n=1 Tax=Solanum lycopersicum TaxID=4081 RepID=K4C4X1_SOLLC
MTSLISCYPNSFQLRLAFNCRKSLPVFFSCMRVRKLECPRIHFFLFAGNDRINDTNYVGGRNTWVNKILRPQLMDGMKLMMLLKKSLIPRGRNSHLQDTHLHGYVTDETHIQKELNNETAIGDVLGASESTSKSPEVRVCGKLLATSTFENKEYSLVAGKIESTNESGEKEFSDAKLDVESVINPNGTDQIDNQEKISSL